MNSNVTSGFDIAAEIASIAIDEFKSHYMTKNFTGLIQRYYRLVEEDFGGKFNINAYVYVYSFAIVCIIIFNTLYIYIHIYCLYTYVVTI